jgi:orotidine-5'-phosphate decarboxylase
MWSDVNVMHFGDRFILRAREVGTPLCVGLDPHLASIPAEFGVRPEQPCTDDTVAGVTRFMHSVLEECAGQVAVVKPQIAFFEQLGWRGLRALEELVQRARELELLVLLDAKRGDIGSTAQAYCDAYLKPDSPWAVDAVTLNPYLGLDSLEPFARAAREYGAGLFVLARTSNRGAQDFQNRLLDGAPLYQHVARALGPLCRTLRGSTGWSSLGVVAGATYPVEARQLRGLLPKALFLVPGYGAQGASASDALAGFVAGPEGAPEGGLVNSSRGVLFPDASEPLLPYREGLRLRIERARQELAQASESTSMRPGSEAPGPRK